MLTRVLIGGLLVMTALAIPACGGNGERGGETGGTDHAGMTEQGVSLHDEELRTEVQELTAFHEVIFELWHNAWPTKDYEQMKELLPDVKKHVLILERVELPGILRDKKPDWTGGVNQLKRTLAKYEEAAAQDDEEGLLTSVELLHSDFEALVRIVRPILKELDDYHVELYQIYHYHMPNRDLEKLRATATRMAERCAALIEAQPPRGFHGDPHVLATATETLCARTVDLLETLQGEDWTAIEGSVERVHDQYRAVVGLFE